MVDIGQRLPRGHCPTDVAEEIKNDLESWRAHMGNVHSAFREDIPDFWDELNTSERLGDWLASCGYRKKPL
jgi:hypothetical protein